VWCIKVLLLSLLSQGGAADAANYPLMSLLLCWPPKENQEEEEEEETKEKKRKRRREDEDEDEDEDAGSGSAELKIGGDFEARYLARDALMHYRGRTLIFVGEGSKGGGGQTAGPLFWDEVERGGWVCGLRLKLPSWPFVSDELSVWTRPPPDDRDCPAADAAASKGDTGDVDGSDCCHGGGGAADRVEIGGGREGAEAGGGVRDDGGIRRRALLQIHRDVWEEELGSWCGSVWLSPGEKAAVERWARKGGGGMRMAVARARAGLGC
jgi:hypothetical protein